MRKIWQKYLDGLNGQIGITSPNANFQCFHDCRCNKYTIYRDTYSANMICVHAVTIRGH